MSQKFKDPNDEYFIKPCPFCGNPILFTVEYIGKGTWRAYTGHIYSEERDAIDCRKFNCEDDIRYKQIVPPNGSHQSKAFVVCNICHTQGPVATSEKYAIESWNNRDKRFIEKCIQFERNF